MEVNMSSSLLLVITGTAVLMDLYQMRIKNGWIIFSFLLALINEICINEEKNLLFFICGAGVPLVLLGWLFYFRMLGSGDIKLFCVLGAVMGPYHILWCIWYAFLAGALLSLAVLVLCGNFRQRLRYLAGYLTENLGTCRPKPYYRKGNTMENIHFTVPIFMSVMLYAGGIY